MGDKMTAARLDASRREVEETFDDASPFSALLRAARSLVSAADYEDEVLVAAYAAEIQDAIVRVVTGMLRDGIHQADYAMAYGRSAVKRVEQRLTSRSLDSLGRSIGDCLNDAHRRLHDNPLPGQLIELLRHHSAADILDEMASKAAEVLLLRHELLHNWPWSDRPFPPFDRAKVEAARARFAAGEPGIPVRDLIRQLDAELEANPD